MGKSGKESGNKWQKFTRDEEWADTETTETGVDDDIDGEAEESADDGGDDDDDGGGTANFAQDILEHAAYKSLANQLTAMEAKADENWDKAVRASAELENFRRRAERDVSHAHKYGLEKLVREILPVIDSLEQALQIEADSNEAVGNIHHGVELTHQLLLSVLQKFAIESIDPVGEAFDPKLHEAMSMQEDNNVKPGSVLMVLQKGYLLHERVIRPARVIVAKNAVE